MESYQKLNEKNEWVDIPLSELPPQLHAQLFEAQYGHIEDWELGEGTSELRNITI